MLLAPWGLAASGSLGAVALAIALLFCKALAIGAAVVVVESSFAKLRLYKIPEFTVASFTLAVLAVVIFLFGPGFGNLHLSVFGAAATITAVGVLLLELLMIRSQEVWEQLRLYALASLLVAALAIATAASGHGGSSLYVLAAVTIALKALLFPLGIRFVLRNLDAEPRVPSTMGTPSAILIAGLLCAFAFVALRPIHIGAVAALPLSALPVAVGGVLTAFLLMVLRPYAPSQLLGFLVLENAVSVAALVIAPGLPIILALLLLFDVLIGVLVFVVLVQYLAVQRTAVRTDILNRLDRMSWALYTLLAVPLLAVALSLLDGWRLARAATLLAGFASLALVIVIALEVDHGRVLQAAQGWLRVDSLGAVFLLATGLLYAMAGVFSIGYLGVEISRVPASGGSPGATTRC